MSDQDNDPSHLTTDPVRELLNQPKLTSEQRQQKRQELLQRQKEARESSQPLQTGHETAAPTVNSISAAESDSMTTTTLPRSQDTLKVEPREDLIKQAMEFLNAPSVRNAELSKKLAFLERKGLTKEEIDIAQARVKDGSTANVPSSSASPSTIADLQPNKTEPQHAITPPPPPPRPAYPLNFVSNQVVASSTPPMPIWKIATILLFISYGALTITAGILKMVFAPILKKLTLHRQSLAGHQTALLKRLASRLNQFNGLNQSPAEAVEGNSPENVADSTDVEKSPKPLEVLVNVTTANTVELKSFLTSFEEFSKLRAVSDTKSVVGTGTSKTSSKQTPLEEFREALTSFSRDVTKQLYSVPYPSFTATGRPWESTHSRSDQVEDNGIQEMKSEIRSLKGMLLNRRNFPMVGNTNGPVDGDQSKLNETQS